MASDGRIRIDIDMAIDKIMQEANKVDKRLESIGEGTGDQLNKDFNANAEKVSDKSGSTSKKVKDDFSDPVKQKLEADDSNLSEKVASAKASLEKLPDEEITRLKADAEDAGITDFDKLLEALPEEEITKLLAKAEKGEVIDFDELIDEVPKKKTTNLKADAEEHGIVDFDKLLQKLPKSVRTKLEAMAEEGEVIDYEKLLRSIPTKYLTELELNDNASEGLRNIQSEAEETQGKFSRLKDIIKGSFIGGAVLQGVSAIGRYLKDTASEAMTASDAMQGFQATMELAGKSSKTIKSVGKDVKEYADTTVYDLKDVSSTTAQLAANGVKGYEKLTEAAGNLTAVAGGTKEDFKSITMVMTQTAGAGKLTTENWNQLTDAIPGASGKLQEAMKKNGAYTGDFRDAMADGQISAEEFNKAIEELGMTDKAKEYAKGTAAFEGAFGNLKSEVVNGVQAMIDAIGKSNITGAINGLAGGASKAFGLIVKSVGPVKRAFSDLGKIISPIGKIIGTIAKGAFSVFADIIGDVVDGIKSLKDNAKDSEGPVSAIAKTLEKLADHQKALTLVGKAIGIIGTALFALKGTAKIVDGVTTALTAIPKVIGGISGAFDLLGTSLLLNPITWIAGIIIGVGVAFYEAYKHIKPFREAINKAGTAIKEGLGTAVDWVKDLPDKFSETWNNIKRGVSEGWKKITGAISEHASNIWKKIKKPFKKMAKNISDIWTSIKKGAKKGWETIKGVIHGVAVAIKIAALAPFVVLAATIVSIWGAIKKPTKAAWKLIKKYIINPIKSAVRSVKGWLESMKKSMSRISNAISKAWHKVWNAIASFFSGIWKKIKKIASNAYNAIKRGVSNAWEAVKRTFHKIWDPIASFFGRIWKKLKKSASSGYNSIKKGVSNAWSSVKRGFHKIWDPIASFFSKTWKKMKKSAKKGWSFIRDGVGGAWDTVSKKWKKLWGGLRDFFSDIWTSIKKSAKGGINGVIGWLNGGIGGINKVIHTFGGSKHAIGKIKKLAAGGSGYRGIAQVNDGNGEEAILKGGQAYKVTGKNAYVNLEGDETVVPHEASRSMFGESIAHYAGGSKNWFSSLTGWVKDKWDGIVNFIKHPIKSLGNIVTNAMGRIRGSELVTKFTPALGHGLVKGISGAFVKMLKKLKNKHDEDKDAPKGAGVQRWKGQVKDALKANGLSTSKAMVNKVLRQIATESGGNEKAVQGNIGDINNKTGDLAKGLMQTISTTFNANAFKGHHNIFNGYDNLLAALRYAKKRYGSSLSFLGNGHGYDGGGYIPKPSIVKVSEKNGERIINSQRDSADGLIMDALNERAQYAPNSFSAKVSHIVKGAQASNGRGGLMPHYNGNTVQSNSSNGKPLIDYNSKLDHVEQLLGEIAGKNLTVDGSSFSKTYEGYGSAQRVQRQIYSDRGLAINANIN